MKPGGGLVRRVRGLRRPVRSLVELSSPPVDLGEFVRRSGELVVQPRMGFGSPTRMRAGLAATKRASATTVGTITLDSYTRVGDLAAAERALRDGDELNGYPIVSHGPAVTGRVLAGIRDEGFPVQVRHGSAAPREIFAALVALGINATEGGPVSYCLPYGRTPLAESVRNWAECAERFTALREAGAEPHLETFGGCMLGQLCPPSQLVAISVLEALFFHRHGLRSLSVSYAQQTNPDQDREAVLALRRLCSQLLPVPSWHVVIYAYMGAYPVTVAGATRLLGKAAELAVTTGAERLIVKTVAESRRIPTIAENVAALEHAATIARRTAPAPLPPAPLPLAVPAVPPAAAAPVTCVLPAVPLAAVARMDHSHGRTGQMVHPRETGLAAGADSQTYRESAALVDAVLNLDTDLGTALLRAFERGVLDIPYCVHPDNAGRTRSYVDGDGWLRWAELGSLPLRHLVPRVTSRRITSAGLLADLSYVRRTFDIQ